MTRAKWLILSSVPVVMAINLLLLNYFLGTPVEAKNIDKKTSPYTIKKTLKSVNVIAQNTTSKFQTRRKLTALSFPKPAAHTFAGHDQADVAEAEERIKTDGVILK